MRIKIVSLLIAAIVALGAAGCTTTDTANVSSAKTASGNESPSIDKAYPYVFEKGPGYSGDVSSLAVRKCSALIGEEPSPEEPAAFLPLNNGELWDPATPSVKDSEWYDKLVANSKKAEPNSVGEASVTLLNLLQTYHPDKVGMELLFDATTNQSGISIIGKGESEELSWNEIIKKLDIPQDKGSTELATLISSAAPKVRVKYVKNSTEKICLAAQGLTTDLFGTGYIDPENHRMTFDARKDMVNYSVRHATPAVNGGLLEPSVLPPTTLAALDYNINIAKLIGEKYRGLLYYSEF